MKGKNVALAVGALLIIGLLAGGGAVMASDGAVPGDMLYGLDLKVEDVQRSLINDEATLADFELDVMEERFEELEVLEELDEDVVDEEDLEGLLDDIAEQQEVTGERVREMNELGDGEESEDAEKNRVTSRYENQVQEKKEYTNKLQEEWQNKYSEGVEDSLNEVVKGYGGDSTGEESGNGNSSGSGGSGSGQGSGSSD